MPFGIFNMLRRLSFSPSPFDSGLQNNWITDLYLRPSTELFFGIYLDFEFQLLRSGTSPERKAWGGETVNSICSLGTWYHCVHALIRGNQGQGFLVSISGEVPKTKVKELSPILSSFPGEFRSSKQRFALFSSFKKYFCGTYLDLK